MKFREEGNEKCAKLRKLIYENPSIVDAILDGINAKQNEKLPVKMTAEEGLSVLLDGDFSKAQYLLVRACSKAHNSDIFPP